MKKQERQTAILNLIQQQGKIRTSTICNRFDIVPMTARRDLQELEKQGKIIRTHGGAILKEKQIFDAAIPIDKRLKINTQAKEQIALKALRFLQPEDHIFIASGSTIEIFAQKIPDDLSLTVVTNSINVVLDLAQKKQIQTYMIGGAFRQKSMTMTGPIAIRDLKLFSLNKAFVGVNAIDDQGHLYTSSVVENELLEYLSMSVPNLYVLADASKFHKKDFVKINIMDPYTLITNQIDITLRKDFLEYGIQIP